MLELISEMLWKNSHIVSTFSTIFKTCIGVWVPLKFAIAAICVDGLSRHTLNLTLFFNICFSHKYLLFSNPLHLRVTTEFLKKIQNGEMFGHKSICFTDKKNRKFVFRFKLIFIQSVVEGEFILRYILWTLYLYEAFSSKYTFSFFLKGQAILIFLAYLKLRLRQTF